MIPAFIQVRDTPPLNFRLMWEDAPDGTLRLNQNSKTKIKHKARAQEFTWDSHAHWLENHP